MASVGFKGKRHALDGDMPVVGARAPDFSLVDGDLNDVSLGRWQGRRKILNVFPSIDTPVCGESVKVFDRHAGEHEDIVMLMISADTPFAQARFCKECGLESVVTLSAIRSDGFGRHYGVSISDGPLEGFFARAVFVLDENDVVVHRQLVEDIGDEPDYRSALKALGLE